MIGQIHQSHAVGGANGSTMVTGSHPSWSGLFHLGFFLVHSYEQIGLYQFSTVNHVIGHGLMAGNIACKKLQLAKSPIADVTFNLKSKPDLRISQDSRSK
jgi:hypothetical protein